MDDVAIDEVQVFPDRERKRVRIVPRLISSTGRQVTARLRLAVRPRPGGSVLAEDETDVPVRASTEVVRELSLGPDARTWDVHTPTLYVLNASLHAKGDGRDHADEHATRFGLRQVGGIGRFELNGRPFDLSGTEESLRSPGRACSSPVAGRLAADLPAPQIPGPACLAVRWGVPDGGRLRRGRRRRDHRHGRVPGVNREAEIPRILRAYGNHPSFCLITLGGGHSQDRDAGGRLVERLRREDPRRVYLDRGP